MTVHKQPPKTFVVFSMYPLRLSNPTSLFNGVLSLSYNENSQSLLSGSFSISPFRIKEPLTLLVNNLCYRKYVIKKSEKKEFIFVFNYSHVPKMFTAKYEAQIISIMSVINI
jgi:hypothetical protein